DLEDALDTLAVHFPLVVIKCGGTGAMLAASGQRHSATAPKVKVVDTTGAGDAFNAGFLDRYLAGHPLPDCLAAGIATGSLSVQTTGGVPASAPNGRSIAV